LVIFAKISSSVGAAGAGVGGGDGGGGGDDGVVAAGVGAGGGGMLGVSGFFPPHAAVVIPTMTIVAAKYPDLRIIYVFSSS
jgi:hypothetical protein